ncbi:MAG: hypothetical protein IJM15_08250 [Erysipelotrichaceae bacterium]|nr:hypothetical protein [Erysipelotrichaceae bacterium]
MNLKKLVIILLVLLAAVMFGLYVYGSKPYSVGEDEIALYIKMDVKEDVGLIVMDYSFDDYKYSGGIANADKSMIKHGTEIIYVWSRQEFEDRGDVFGDRVKIGITFRIITEYIDPNYENDYPEELTAYLDPIEFETDFGKAYNAIFTGDKVNGYSVKLQAREE